MREMNTDWETIFTIRDYVGPFQVKSDCDYESAFVSKISKFVRELENVKLDSGKYTEIKQFADELMHTVHLYYEGSSDDAQSFIRDCLEDFKKGTTFFSNVNENAAFHGFPTNAEVQFFRARVGNDFCNYSRREMFHVPFTMRGKIETTRFSISGLPCLYLSNTSYGCWLELGKPQDSQIAVSPVIVTNEVSVLNLAISIYDIYEFSDLKRFGSESEREEYFTEYAKLMVLMIASSFVVDEEGRKFKSEYIVSQMIMLAIKDSEYDGVAYYSKKTAGDMYSRAAINLALYARYNPNTDDCFSGDLARKVKIGDSYNLATFQHLKRYAYASNSYRMAIDDMGGRVGIGERGRFIHYRDTIFHDFDVYMFSNWKNREYPI